MREPRYRFSDPVRATTQAIALRMIHAGEIAASSQELAAWIDRTDDVRERLTQGGYGEEFSADDLFPLFQGFVAKVTAASPAPRPSRSTRRLSTRAIVVIVAIVVVVVLGIYLA
jgi:hypothetical protein